MKKKGWFSRNLAEIRETLFHIYPEDSSSKKAAKRIGWYMFLIMMSCAMLVMLVAISFAH